MAQIRNRFDIQNSINENPKALKKLPNFFDAKDEVSLVSGMTFSVLVHIAFILLLMIISLVSGLVFPHLPKPELPNRDVEFKLVQNESRPPINKKTKIRSDRDSQAGGIHNPKKPVSEPSPAPAPVKKPSPAPSKAKAPNKIQNPIQKLVQKPIVKPAPSAPKVVNKPAKPSPIKAPVNKPTARPAAPTAKPSAPRLVSAPKSPFTVGVPKTSAPVGSTYRPQASGTSRAATSGGSSAPAPRFSSTSGSRAGSSGGSYSGSRAASGGSGSYASRGGGYGNAGNPSPGNPNGRPGIDAIRQPNWGPYMRDLEQRIKRNWIPPKGDSSKRVVITFTIGRDGRLLSKSITKSSGVPLADRAAMKAIELTAPFRPLPPEFKGSSVPIEFTFDYNVLNSVLK